MWFPIEQMPGTSRVWIYAVERPLTSEEVAQVDQYLTSSIQDWKAHGVPMKASHVIFAHQLVLIVADEAVTSASGCSIDASTRWFKSLEESTGLNWFDRSLFYLKGESELGKISAFGIKKAVQDGILRSETPVFPAQVDSWAEWQTWPRPAVESTLKRYFEPVS